MALHPAGDVHAVPDEGELEALLPHGSGDRRARVHADADLQPLITSRHRLLQKDCASPAMSPASLGSPPGERARPLSRAAAASIDAAWPQSVDAAWPQRIDAAWPQSVDAAWPQRIDAAWP